MGYVYGMFLCGDIIFPFWGGGSHIERKPRTFREFHLNLCSEGGIVLYTTLLMGPYAETFTFLAAT